MDERKREAMAEETGLAGDIGENVVVAEYDIASHGERRHGERREGMEAHAKGEATSIVAGTAQARKLRVNGAVGVSHARKTRIKGFGGVVLGDRTKLTGAAPLVVGRHDVRIEKGGTALALAGRELELKDHGYAGVVLAPRVEVKDGGRVFVTALAALLGGLAIGMGWGLVVLAGYLMLRNRGFVGRIRARRMMRSGMLGEVTEAGDRLTEAVRKVVEGL